MKSSLALVVAVVGLCVVVTRGQDEPAATAVALKCIQCVASDCTTPLQDPSDCPAAPEARSCEVKLDTKLESVLSRGCSTADAPSDELTCDEGGVCLCKIAGCNSCEDYAKCNPKRSSDETTQPEETDPTASGSQLKPLSLISFIIFITLIGLHN